MAQRPEPPNSSQPFLPPPAAPGPRGLPRPTPIGALVGVVALLLCLAAVGLAALLTNTRGAGRTPTPAPRTALATRAGGPTGTAGAPTATRAAGAGVPGTPRTALPAGVPSAAVPPPLNPAAPPPPQTVPPEIATAGAAGGEPTAVAPLPPTATGLPLTAAALLAPTVAAPLPPTVAPPTATPAPLTAAERTYLAAFNDQAVTWRNGMTAFNVEMQGAAPSDPGWLQDVHITSGQILDLTTQVLKLPAPPRLAAIDARYKSAARATALAMQALLKWVDTRNPQVLQQFNSDMRQGSDDLQASVAAIAAFEANPAAAPVLPPAAPAAPTPAVPPNKPAPPAAPTSTPLPPPALPPTKAAPPTSTPPAKPAPGLVPAKPVPTNTPGSSSQAQTPVPGRPPRASSASIGI